MPRSLRCFLLLLGLTALGCNQCGERRKLFPRLHDRLSRDELQGVIAHEFSHVLNGDMRLNLKLMGLIFGLLVLGLTGRKVLEHTEGGDSIDPSKAVAACSLRKPEAPKK